MRLHYFGVMMLAIGAGGIVWVAVEQRPAVTAAVATAVPTVAVPIEDAGHLAATEPVARDAQSSPPPADDAAWNAVRWSMSPADVEVALQKTGAVVEGATTGKKQVHAKRGPWEATIDFDARGAQQIVVTSTDVSKEEADALLAKINERAPATKTIARSERRWKMDGGAGASLVTSVDDATATLREEHVRESAPGDALGFAGLRWGMSTQEVVHYLGAAGYAARVVKAPEADSVQFEKGGASGTASLNQFGLRRVAIAGPTVDRGAARAKELESSLGEPASLEASTKTQHVDQARMTSIEVEVTERRSGFTVVETYRPIAKR